MGAEHGEIGGGGGHAASGEIGNGGAQREQGQRRCSEAVAVAMHGETGGGG